jgi:dethiobiotin synthetase
MIRGLFVTGTDTGVGKTVVAALLLRALGETRRAVGMKPVAAALPTANR